MIALQNKLAAKVGILPARPLPQILDVVRFRRPDDLSTAPVAHFRVGTGIAEGAKIDSAGLAVKMREHFRETDGQPLIIEAAPALLGEDIITGIASGGLKDQLDSCHGIFFCSDLYDLQNERVNSYSPGLFAVGPEIYVNSRRESDLFLSELGYFNPLAHQLSWLKAVEMTKGIAQPLLQKLYHATAVSSLLAEIPFDHEARGSFLRMLHHKFAEARMMYEQLGRTNLTDSAENFPDAAITLYDHLAHLPILQPIDQLATPKPARSGN